MSYLNTLSMEQIRRIDMKGGDLYSTSKYGGYDAATLRRIQEYLDRPCDPASNGSGEYY